MTDAVEETAMSQNRDDFLEHDGKESSASNGEGQVVDQEGVLEASAKRLPALHDRRASIEDGEVRDDGCAR